MQPDLPTEGHHFVFRPVSLAEPPDAEPGGKDV